MQNLFLKNTLKAITILLAAFIMFFIMIVMFPAFGILTSKGIPLTKIILESIMTIIPALIVIIPFSMILGWMTSRLKKRRLIWLLLTGILIYLLCIFVAMISHSGVSILNEGFGTLVLIVLWAFLAYFMFVIPFLIIGIFILEKWTR